MFHKVMIGVLLSAVAACAAADVPELLPLSASNATCLTDAENPFKNLGDWRQRESDAALRIFTERCSGGLYLGPIGGKPTHILFEGAWFQELVAVHWLAPETLRLRVHVAQSRTSARKDWEANEIVLYRNNDSWHSDGLHPLGRPFDFASPLALPGGRVNALLVDRPEQMENLQFDRVSSEIDYATERVLLAPILLSSGSKRIVAINVQREVDHYLVSWQTNRPRIGTADLNPTVVWVVLPKDGLPIRYGASDSGLVCIECRSGAAHRSNVKVPPGYQRWQFKPKRRLPWSKEFPFKKG